VDDNRAAVGAHPVRMRFGDPRVHGRCRRHRQGQAEALRKCGNQLGKSLASAILANVDFEVTVSGRLEALETAQDIRRAMKSDDNDNDSIHRPLLVR
jgi:hypothetical protein